MKKDSDKAKDPALDALQKASKGLLWPSESEAPLEPFLRSAPRPRDRGQVRATRRRNPGRPWSGGS